MSRMLKVDKRILGDMERQHPGITDTIRRFETTILPTCPYCHAADTAVVESVTVPGSASLAFVSTKLRLEWRAPKPGEYYCNACGQYFD